ncbi:MAG: hypothetical protein DRN20_03460 [Thermoplasmata archaeon]|nr:MAG: hypothetical protein DRN20_03460 [Thermoplasmata archaeon]
MNDEIKRIIKYWANWAFTRLPTCVYDFEDLENEAIVLYYQLLAKYNGDENNFKYYFERALRNQFHKLVKREYHRRHRQIPTDLSIQPANINDPENSKLLSSKERQILRFVLQLASTGQTKRLRERVQKQFNISAVDCAGILCAIGNSL